MAQLIRITAKREGFRRAGITHPTTPTEYPLERFAPEQLEALQAEPMLVVDLVSPPADEDASKTDKGKTGKPA